MKALFEVVAGPLAQPHTPGVRFRGLRTVAFDGCNSLKVPDTPANRSWLGRIRYRMGWAGYPTLRLMTLVETGTRGLLGATLGSGTDRDEATLAKRLLPLLGPGMLVLLDRAFDANAFLASIASTGAMLLARSKSTRNPPVLEHLPDGSYLSELDGLRVRIIEADLTMSGADGSRVRDRYRLITTLLDHRCFPADALVELYHERWEIESAYLALRHTLLNGHVLRSGDRLGLEQETWALLTLYQLLRMAMVTAVETHPGTNPDRTSFTTALETARQELTAARSIYPEQSAELPDAIGRAVLATLLPARRPATAPAKSNAPPPATSTATMPAPVPRPPSPPSISSSTPRPSISIADPAATPPHHAHPHRRPAETASWPS
jgi:Transposase DDE domain